VRDVVLDASVVLKWFRTENERHIEQAHALRAAYESGELAVLVPPLLVLEVLNVAGRTWRMPEPALVDVALALEGLRFERVEPPLEEVARWTARGMSAYDAAYVALAESEEVVLVTDDERLAGAASSCALALAEAL
jgi:predicted nucleic acid-binding protein